MNEDSTRTVVVNADDFGASRGINRAILELHRLGVVTSASLMVTMPAADDAAVVARLAPGLGVGLHTVLTYETGEPLFDFDDTERCSAAIESQVDEFVLQLGRLPSHLDSHQNVHRDARLLPLFQNIATRYGLPLREHSNVRYFSGFYGQWDGVPHPEHIAIDSLLRMLENEIQDCPFELSCHPAYADVDFVSSYADEREIERRTLADPRLRMFFRGRRIRLVRFSDVWEPASIVQ